MSSNEDDKPIKVDKWDPNAVRIAMDDAAKKVLLDLGYEENFRLVDMRLVICTLSVVFAGIALLWDFLYPFPASKPVLMLCVFSYFVLMGILTLHANFNEKNIFLVAHQKDPIGTEPDIVWQLSSTMVKYEKNYTLTMSMKETDREERSGSMTKCVGEVFDAEGNLQFDVFHPMVMDLHDSITSLKKSQ